MTRGQRIKAARKNSGLTQKELGSRLGVAYQTVAQWENDLRNPKYETVQRIADALGVPESYFWGSSPFSSLDEAIQEHDRFSKMSKATPNIHGVIEAIFGKQEIIKVCDKEQFYIEKLYSFGSGDDPVALDDEGLTTIEEAVYTLVESLVTSLKVDKSDFIARWEKWFQSEEAENIRQRARERDGVLGAVDPKENE